MEFSTEQENNMIQPKPIKIIGIKIFGIFMLLLGLYSFHNSFNNAGIICTGLGLIWCFSI